MILVTGGTGMVGAHVLLKLVEEGYKVRAIKRKSSSLQQVERIFSFYSNNPHEQFGKIEWVDADLLDYSSLKKALNGISIVIHSAAIVSFHKEDKQQMMHNNIEGTANLVNASIELGIEKFCHVSSIAAVGRAEKGELTTEKHQWVPEGKHSNYSNSKFFSEMEVWRGIEEGLEAVVINPSVILGAGDWEHGSPQYFSMIDRGLKFYSKGGTGYVDVTDVVDVITLLIKDEHWKRVKGERFILNAENCYHRDVFNMIADNLDVARPKWHATPFMLDVGWRLLAFVAFITRQRARLTQEMVSGSHHFNKYSGTKITQFIPFNYKSVKETIDQIAAIYKGDRRK